MPSLETPFDVFEDKRKWYQIWRDNIWSLDYVDLIPSIIIGGGVGYGLFLGGLMALTFSISTGGFGLGVLAVSALTWQLFKYPIKRLAANIVSPFTEEKPKWGQSIDENVKSLESHKNSSYITEGQLRLENKSLSDYMATQEKKFKIHTEEIQSLTSKAEILYALKVEHEKRIELLEGELKLTKEMNVHSKQLTEIKVKTAVDEVSQKYKDEAESATEGHEQAVQDLKHEHDKVVRSLNYKLKKASESTISLKSRNAELVLKLEGLGASIDKPPSYEPVADSKSRSSSPTFFKSQSSESEGPMAPITTSTPVSKIQTLTGGSVSE